MAIGSEGAFKELGRAAVTLEDVARSAGVSPATVSRCLNNPAIVRPALKAKVDAAIERLEYLPNGAARALASQQLAAQHTPQVVSRPEQIPAQTP